MYFQKSRSPSEVAAEAVNIDVTPIMNMFIILIPFLVSMAVFTQLSIIEFSLPPNVGTGLDTSKGKPKLKITVVMAGEYLAITQGDTLLDSISQVQNDYDYELLEKQLAVRRIASDIKDEMIIAVRDEIKFKFIVKVMDVSRNIGFEKIGLSSAVENVEKL